MDRMNRRDEIVEIANKFFIYTDQRNWEGVKATFADEVLFDTTSMSGCDPVRLKPQQIVDTWDSCLKKLCI